MVSLSPKPRPSHYVAVTAWGNRNLLTNKRILLGVTGGIAAYKSADLIRRLQDSGADVQVVMTPAAQEFITPLTLQALSGNPVHTSLLDPEAEAGMGHIELSRWADLILVAPASADFISRLAAGAGDDLLTTLCLATSAPICIAPAMNQGMWNNPATGANLETLKSRGIRCFGPGAGSQACGDVGLGRMLEPLELVELTCQQFEQGALEGKKVLITAGPTREAIDPVRYISNHSSGKMGFALAEAARDAGAAVTLICGPCHLETPDRVTRINIESAQEMYDTTMEIAQQQDLFIASAAVADYRPATLATEKIKKTHQDSMTIELVKNPDIVASVAALNENRPFTVGFAAETQSVIEYARSKLQKKQLDMVIANDVSKEGIGFNSDNNEVIIIAADGNNPLPAASKKQLARMIIEQIRDRLHSNND